MNDLTVKVRTLSGVGREQGVRNLLCQVVHEQLQHLPVLLREPVDEAVDLRDSGLLVFQL